MCNTWENSLLCTYIRSAIDIGFISINEYRILENRKTRYVIVISQDEYDILVITQVGGEAEDEC